MPVIHLITIINAPQERVFDLSRSIDLHQQSMQHTNEKAVAGRTTGLMLLNETVTWHAKHLFKVRALTVKITAMQPYDYFIDEMQQGDFKSMHHEHHFNFTDRQTIMKDVFSFETPFGIIGKILCKIFLTSYMTKLLQQRNLIIKEYAETGKWKMILPH
ncbi:hypothetical protein BH10BAC2_BH10BAC2_13630 [soil metagenome]